MAIKVITFDYWNTIFDSSMGINRNAYRLSIIRSQFERFGKQISNEEFDKALAKSWEHFNNIWINEHRTPLTEESVEFFWNYLNMPPDKEAILAISNGFAQSILEHKPKLIDGVKDIIIEFSKKYKLGIISDTGFSPGTVLRELLDFNGLLKYFSEFSFSDETGVSKPHKQAFLTILEPLECPPEQALHIGDIEDTDVAGAKALGMRAIRFSGAVNEVTELRTSKSTAADAEVFSWKQVPAIVAEMDNSSLHK